MYLIQEKEPFFYVVVGTKDRRFFGVGGVYIISTFYRTVHLLIIMVVHVVEVVVVVHVVTIDMVTVHGFCCVPLQEVRTVPAVVSHPENERKEFNLKILTTAVSTPV